MKLLSLTLPGSNTPVQVPQGVPTGGLETGGAGQRIIQLGLEILIVGSIIITLFFLFSAGWTWMTSEGDKASLQSARNKLVYAILGLVVVLTSFLIIRTVGGFFNIPLLK